MEVERVFDMYKNLLQADSRSPGKYCMIWVGL